MLFNQQSRPYQGRRRGDIKRYHPLDKTERNRRRTVLHIEGQADFFVPPKFPIELAGAEYDYRPASPVSADEAAHPTSEEEEDKFKDPVDQAIRVTEHWDVGVTWGGEGVRMLEVGLLQRQLVTGKTLLPGK